MRRTQHFAFIRAVLGVGAGLILTSATLPAGAEAELSRSERREALVAGEVLFHAYQSDYFEAITHLELAREKGLLPQARRDWEFLLTRLKLGYGLHDEARKSLPGHLSPSVPNDVRNRTSYELARALFRRGYPEAALQALESVQGAVPEDILGEFQLLHAHVLMGLGRYREAVDVLRKWKGAESLTGYALYNRGIAQLRAGNEADAIVSLKRIARMPATDEELLSLKDKANLTLGYIFLRMDDLGLAQERLEQVREDSPSSNRALLALGWIAQEQGRGKDALGPWMQLRKRAVTDPAVQESLLAVPFVQREMRSFQAAARHYEQAVAVLSNELSWLDDTLESMQRSEGWNVLMLETARPAGGASGVNAAPESSDRRYLGPLLASRVFVETSRGHSELRSMLEDLNKGLENIDKLAKERRKNSAEQVGADQPGRSSTRSKPTSNADIDILRAEERKSAGSSVEWETAGRAGRSNGKIPSLPELELPPEGAIDPLPDSDFLGLPESEVIGLPESQVIGFPESTVIGFPESEWISFPDTGRFKFPVLEDDDNPFPDALAREGQPDGSSRRSARSFGGPSVDLTSRTLKELAGAVGQATERMERVVGALGSSTVGSGFAERLAALRQRLLRLRDRVAAAIALYENYANALATEELKRRQTQVEQYLEQARLELAKTYDLATER